MFELRGEAAPVGAEGAQGAEVIRSGLFVDPIRVIAALRRGRRVVIGSAIAGLFLGVLLAKTVVPREFTAVATIAWEPGTPLGPETRQDGRELRTLADSMKVQGNLAEVRRRLSLPVSVEELSRLIEVDSNDKSNLIVVEAKGGDADTPPRVANALVDIFLERRVDAQRSRLDALFQAASRDAEKAREELAAARKAFEQFRDDNGVADPATETQAAIQQEAKLRADADAARAEAAGEEARTAALKVSARKEPRTTVLSSTELRPRVVKLAETQAELAGTQASLSPEHPKAQALAARADGLRNGTEGAPDSVIGERVIGRNPQADVLQQLLAGSGAQREAAVRRQAALLSLADVAAARVAKLRVMEGKASELTAAIRLNEGRVDEAEKLRAKAADVLARPASGFRVVDQASPPERASKSHRRVFALAAPFVAALIALLAILARTFRGLRVVAARELAFWGGGPVVASSAYPSDPSARRDLVVDLWAYGAEAQGSTLVVAMGEAERPLAELVGAALNTTASDDEEPSRGAAHVSVWTGELSGPALRRTARFADRVLVVVLSGAHSAPSIAALQGRIGRTRGVGFVLLGVSGEIAEAAPDRAGDAERFFQSGAAGASASVAEVSHA